jgi:hypothetical protein
MTRRQHAKLDTPPPSIGRRTGPHPSGAGATRAELSCLTPPASLSQPYAVAPPSISGRAAVLVIHGIGEQKPYEALGAFGQGLAEHFGTKANQLSHHLVWREGKAHSVVRLPLPPSAPLRELDLYEFHWAPLVQGRITIRQVLLWIVRTSLTPLRSISQQWEVLSMEPNATRRQWWIALREILRAMVLIVVALLILAPFIIAALKHDVLIRALKMLAETLGAVERPLALTAWAILIASALILLWEWVRGLLRGRFGRDIEAGSERRWRIWALVWTAVLLALAWLIQVWRALPIGRVATDLGSALWGAPFVVLTTALLAWLLMRPLVKFLGDVTLYVSADENSNFFRTRADILKASTARLQMMLADDGYAAVYLAGHSLGSVIAYDTVNHLIRDVMAEPADGKLTRLQLERLRALLTFGSPLDKVNYFFRVMVDRHEAIRAQVTSLLHGFRKKSSKRSYGDLSFGTAKFDGLEGFRWLNVYSRADFVSGRLSFYNVDRQEHLGYMNPLTAHLAYWHDARFYAVATTHWLF